MIVALSMITGVAFAGTEDDPSVKEKKVVSKTANGKLQVVYRDGKKALVPVKKKTVKDKD